MLAIPVFAMKSHVVRTDSGLGKGLGWGCAYVRPVERLMPARKAETVDGISLEFL